MLRTIQQKEVAAALESLCPWFEGGFAPEANSDLLRSAGRRVVSKDQERWGNCEKGNNVSSLREKKKRSTVGGRFQEA